MAGAKAVCGETLRTGGKILTNIVENKSPELSAGFIVSKHVTNSVQNLIGNLRGCGGKLVRRGVKCVNKTKRARVIKGIFSPSLLHSPFMSGSEIESVSGEYDIFAHRTIQTSVLGTVETVYKHLSPIDQNDLEFLIPSGSHT